MTHKIDTEPTVKPIPKEHTGKAWYLCKFEGTTEITELELSAVSRGIVKGRLVEEPTRTTTVMRRDVYPSRQDAELVGLLYQIHYYRSRISWGEGQLATFKEKLANAECELAARKTA